MRALDRYVERSSRVLDHPHEKHLLKNPTVNFAVNRFLKEFKYMQIHCSKKCEEILYKSKFTFYFICIYLFLSSSLHPFIPSACSHVIMPVFQLWNF